MVLDNYRSSLDWWLVPLAKALRRIEPDVFTWLSLLAAAGGALAFWRSGPAAPGLLLLAWALVLLNSVLDLLDGKVAKMTGKATARGDFLDHAIDRFSDALLIIGIGLSPWARSEVALFALAGTILTSYMGTQAQAIGIGRNYAGLLGRADRMVLLLAMPLAQYLWAVQGWATPWEAWSLSLLELMLAYFAVMGTATTVQRFLLGLRAFDDEGRVKGGD